MTINPVRLILAEDLYIMKKLMLGGNKIMSIWIFFHWIYDP